MPDWSEINDLQIRLLAAAAAETTAPAWTAHLQARHVVALRMEELTLDDRWNVFLAHIKGILEDDQAMLNRLQAQAGDQETVGDDLLRVKLRAAKLEGGVEKLTLVMALPAQLIAADTAETKKSLTPPSQPA